MLLSYIICLIHAKKNFLSYILWGAFNFYLDRTLGGETGNHGRGERGIGPGKNLESGIKLGSPKCNRTICQSTCPHSYGFDY